MEERPGALVALVGGLALGGYLLLRHPRQGFDHFPFRALVDPGAVAAFPVSEGESEDSFILRAWDWVASRVSYADYNSDIIFVDGQVQCQACLLPRATIRAGLGNCVAMASLLASILRKRIPSSRLKFVIGDVDAGGIGGHAWVEVQRNGQWYVLEATGRPKAQPWVTVLEAANRYWPAMWLNDQEISCTDREFCLVSSCDCQRPLTYRVARRSVGARR